MAREFITIKVLTATHWKIKTVAAMSHELVADMIERLVEREYRKLTKIKVREPKGE